MATDWLQQEEERLERDLEEGFITQAMFNKELRELRREYREAAGYPNHRKPFEGGNDL